MAFTFDDFPVRNIEGAGLGAGDELGAAATFEGEPFRFRILGASGIAVVASTDVDGTLFVEQSRENTGPWTPIFSTAVTGGDPYIRSFFPLADWVRIRYVNGASPQTFIALAAVLIKDDILNPRQRLKEPVDVDEFVPTTRAVLSCEERDNPGNIGILRCGADGSVLTHEVGAATFNTGQTSVGTTAIEIAPTPITNRQNVRLRLPQGATNDVYIGPDNTVTTANGFLLEAGESHDVPIGVDGEIWAITASGSTNVTWMQY